MQPALDEIIATARRLDVAVIGLSVFDDNPTARCLYESRGFRETGSENGQMEMRLELRSDAADARR